MKVWICVLRKVWKTTDSQSVNVIDYFCEDGQSDLNELL